MAKRMLSFIHSRAPRAAGVSDAAINEHKELIHDLYLTQNFTRGQVIALLNKELGFKLSPDQFSKAIKRWGFHKQVHSGRSTQQPSNQTASLYATTHTPSNDLSCTTDGDHTTTGLDPCPLPCPPAKRPNPKGGPDKIVVQSPFHSRENLAKTGDGDTASSLTTEDSTEQNLFHQFFIIDALLLAEYLACCYCYNEAFIYYRGISELFNDEMFSLKQRRVIMLSMARVAKEQRACEIARQMLETELEMSNDPLAQDGYTQGSLKKPEMCRMQSFQFHWYLAQIYARRNDGMIPMQKHVDNARNFTKTFNANSLVRIDLWTLLCLVSEEKNIDIQEDLLGSLQWDLESYGSNIRKCLLYCWTTLNSTKPTDETSGNYEAGHHAITEPKELTDLVLENSPSSRWKQSSILFAFLWKKIQLAEGTLPWDTGHPTITPAHILMIVSRIIVKRSCPMSKPNNDLMNQEEDQLKVHRTSLQLYCDALLGLFQDEVLAPDEIKREFATQFVEHHSWSPPLASESGLALESQTYQAEALNLVWATKNIPMMQAHLSAITEGRTSLSDNSPRKPGASMESDLSRWLGEHQGQRVFTHLKNTDTHVHFQTYLPPTRNSSCLTGSISSHWRYLVTRNGNPTMSRPLASHSSCSSQRSYSSSLQRFKAAALNRQHQPKPTMALSENSDVLMDEDFLEDLQEDEYLDDGMVV